MFQQARLSKSLVLSLSSLVMVGCGSAGPVSTQPTQLQTGLSLSAPAVISAAVSSPLNSSLQASGGTAPYLWSLKSGALPAGITLNSSGTLSGTPTAIANSTVTVSVTDSSSVALTATEQLNIDIIPAGFSPKPALDEEFNESTLNTNLWYYRPGVRDDCTQDPSAVSLSNGHLQLSIYTTTTNGVSTNYCGAIDTSKNFTYTYGYWEAAVRYQYQPGTQCSWWIQSPDNGQNLSDPEASGVEMDVFEHTRTTTNPVSYDQALNWDGYTPGIGKTTANYGVLPDLDNGNFHVFAVAWTPTGYTFYVDGQVTWTVSNSTVPASSALQYVILDTELPSGTVVPSSGYGALGSSSNLTFDVDYVRIYPVSP